MYITQLCFLLCVAVTFVCGFCMYESFVVHELGYGSCTVYMFVTAQPCLCPIFVCMCVSKNEPAGSSWLHSETLTTISSAWS